MSALPQRFAEALDRLNPAHSLVAAVSGGMDSMAMLELLSPHRRNIVVAHFNHQLRGAESDADEAFVRDQAAKRGFLFRSARADVKSAARGISIEMAARKLRHAFLASVANEFSADLLLAHHTDDQIELFFMRILRGIQGPGLGGMNPVSPSPADPKIRILRPLLGFTRAEIQAFVQRHKIPFREDSTNAQFDAERNRLRHLVIPQLRAEYGADFEHSILKQIAAARAKTKIARDIAKAWLDRAGDFTQLPPSIRKEFIAIQLERHQIPVTADRLQKLLRHPAKRISIAPNQTIALAPDGKLQHFGELFPKTSLTLNLRNQTSAHFANIKLTWKFVAAPDTEKKQNTMTFDADQIGDTIILRHWQPGDTIRLSGRSSTRPLHEMFSRNKIPRAQRHRAIVATTAAGQIFWVQGLRITEPFKTTPTSRHYLQWRWET